MGGLRATSGEPTMRVIDRVESIVESVQAIQLLEEPSSGKEDPRRVL